MLRAAMFSRFLHVVAAFLLMIPFSGVAALGAPPASKPNSDQPTDAKALKTFHSAQKWQQSHEFAAAVGDYRKANRQDGGHCASCLQIAYELAMEINDYKQAEEIGRDWLTISAAPVDQAITHYRIGFALQEQGLANRKDKCFTESCDELNAALKLVPQFTLAHFVLGVSMAHLHQDDAAHAQFAEVLSESPKNADLQSRARRFFDNVNLARAKMVPAFAVTTLDGKHITMDSLAGKVVLIDFWATWCGPCREALPHVRRIAKEFARDPLVVISISLDSDEAKWKAFVAKNEMTWLQYRDGGFEGPVARLFGVDAIPATFTIDTDGVVEDQHVGDANIEKTLKKLIAKAEAAQPIQPQTASNPSGSSTVR